MLTPVTLTSQNVPIWIRSLLASRGQDVSNLRNPRIISLIYPALEALAYRVARGEDYRSLQQEFAVTPVAGVVATIDDGAIFDLARSVVKVAATKETLTPVDSLHVLTHADLPTGNVYYAQDGTALRFRDTNGSLTAYATPLTITCNFIPSLADLPAEHHGLFFNTLAGLIEPRPEARAQELSEVGRA